MFIPKGSNKHKERPRLKKISGEVLLCRWSMNKKRGAPILGHSSVCKALDDNP